jgi:hypothetical protein
MTLNTVKALIEKPGFGFHTTSFHKAIAYQAFVTAGKEHQQTDYHY